jgi:hypothetical protein
MYFPSGSLTKVQKRSVEKLKGLPSLAEIISFSKTIYPDISLACSLRTSVKVSKYQPVSTVVKLSLFAK